jgi:thiol:disulfide interchange protein DsbD
MVASYPKIVKIIPKPGKWLSIFKEFMGFAMLLSSVWLIWILMNQIGNENVVIVISSLILVSMFLWSTSHSKDFVVFKCISLCGLILSFSLGLNAVNVQNEECESIPWIEYSQEVFDNCVAEKSPMILNFTASWCLNCQFNQSVFKDEKITGIIKERGIKLIKCDWTNRNEHVTGLLKKYGAVSVPLTVYYPGDGKDYVILPSIFTKSKLLEVINDQK